ncbi:MAG TPA: MBL fold metallo-hydrolase, partial [Nitrospira sp.]
MRLTILGSGTNLHPKRAAAGYLVRTDQTMLLDFGPRTLSNLLKTGVDRHSITHILFSHFHADHFSDFITFYFDAVIYTKHSGGWRPDL